MSGFAESYELLAPGAGHKVMRCFDPQLVPVLSTLALEYGVCDRWFCSLPGETFPNRDFIHAGTSFGHVNLHKWLILNNPPCVFRMLETAPSPKPTWRLYHQGVAHALLYSQLFIAPNRRGSHAQLLQDIRTDNLPSYAFVEPSYGIVGRGYSMHPAQARSRAEFVDAEAFIAGIYRALADTPAVFEKTAFVITFDEHGGFYDHVRPPRSWLPFSTEHFHRDGAYTFRFRMPGPRVPAIVVSPWIEAGTVDHTEREHSCIAETIRRRFLANVAYPLNDRAEGTDLAPVFNRDTPRTDYPDVAPLDHDSAVELEAALAAPEDDYDRDAILDDRLQSTMGDLHRFLVWAGRQF
jgi:phospholipase C